jgi:P27 family predicted phage terminase small subunit
MDSSPKEWKEKMPRPRKSLEDHKLTGTKPTYVEPSSDVPASRPRFPKGISADAKKVFKRLCALLEARKVLTEGDCELLRLYSVTFTRHERALQHLADEGEITTYVRLDSNGQAHDQVKPNLWLDVATNCEKFMRATLADLGLNPLQRSKVKPAIDPKAPKPLTPEEEATLSREAQQPPLDDEIDLNSIDETLVN